MNKEKIAEEIIEEIDRMKGGPIEYCAYCSYPNLCLSEGGYSCPQRNRWLNELKAEIIKLLEK